MARLVLILGLVFAVIALALSATPDAWEKADRKAHFDAEKFASLMNNPDRVGWRLSEDTVLSRTIIWDAEGELRYPPPAGLTPIMYEFSEQSIRNLRSFQSEVAVSEWSVLEVSKGELINCRAKPAICLIYDRAALEDLLGVQRGSLELPKSGAKAAWLLFILVCLSGATWFLFRARQPPSDAAFELVVERHTAKHGDVEVSLTPRDLKLLTVLQERNQSVVTKDELYDAGWGRDYMPNSRALDQHMINLRRKLDPSKSMPPLIETVHGVGYRLVR